MGYVQWGAAAEKIATKPEMLWQQPAGWDSVQSAAFPVNFLTAYLAYWKAGITPDAMEPIRWREQHRPRVLIHAAAGGVGTAAVQLSLQAEYGGWELDRVRLHSDGTRQVKLRRARVTARIPLPRPIL